MLLPLLALLAHAAPADVVVALDARGEKLKTPVVIRLSPPTGERVSVPMNDEGQAPDVTAGDGIWGGRGAFEADKASVSLEVGEKRHAAGSVEWASAGLRDVEVTFKGSKASARVREVASGEDAAAPVDARPKDPAQGPSADGPNPGAGTPIAPGTTAPPASGAAAPGSPPSGAAPAGAQPTSMTFPSSSSSDSDATLFVALGVGLLAAVGVGWAWTRARRPSGSDRVSAASRLPSAGLLGAGTPSLSDGLSVWAAPEGTLEGLAATALALLSERHRVLVVAPSEVTLAPVGGGPVYRLGALRPSHVGDAAEGLHAEGGAPLAVLLVGVAHDGAALREYADLLPGEVGAVALIEGDAQDLGFPLVRLTGEGGVWRAVSGARSARLTRGRLGVRVEPDSSAA